MNFDQRTLRSLVPTLLLSLAAVGLTAGPATAAEIPADKAGMVVKIFTDPQHTQPALHQKFTLRARDSKNVVVEAMTSDMGYTSVLLPKGHTYEVVMETPIGPFVCKECQVPPIPDTEDEVSGTLTFYFDNQRIELKDVNFDTGKATLKPTSYARLDPVAEGMVKNIAVIVEIAGHTDDVGNDESNLKLSQARAEAVRSYLIKKGVAAERLSAVGYGKTQPKVSNATAEGKAMNRRTEARVLQQ